MLYAYMTLKHPRWVRFWEKKYSSVDLENGWHECPFTLSEHVDNRLRYHIINV